MERLETKYLPERPKNPKKGDQHACIDPIGGASYNYYEFDGKKWVFVCNE